MQLIAIYAMDLHAGFWSVQIINIWSHVSLKRQAQIPVQLHTAIKVVFGYRLLNVAYLPPPKFLSFANVIAKYSRHSHDSHSQQILGWI